MHELTELLFSGSNNPYANNIITHYLREKTEELVEHGISSDRHGRLKARHILGLEPKQEGPAVDTRSEKSKREQFVDQCMARGFNRELSESIADDVATIGGAVNFAPRPEKTLAQIIHSITGVAPAVIRKEDAEYIAESCVQFFLDLVERQPSFKQWHHSFEKNVLDKDALIQKLKEQQ